MSRFVKDLEMKHLRKRFEGARDVLVVKVIGINAIDSNKLRLELRKKGIHLQTVKNTLARRVFDELGLSPAKEYLTGTSAVAWGGPGIVELAKEITDWAKKIEKFHIKGGCVSGQAVNVESVKALSEMPSREQLLGEVIGMLIGTAGAVVAQITGPAAQVASQIEKIADKEPAAAAAT